MKFHELSSINKFQKFVRNFCFCQRAFETALNNFQANVHLFSLFTINASRNIGKCFMIYAWWRHFVLFFFSPSFCNIDLSMKTLFFLLFFPSIFFTEENKFTFGKFIVIKFYYWATVSNDIFPRLQKIALCGLIWLCFKIQIDCFLMSLCFQIHKIFISF